MMRFALTLLMLAASPALAEDFVNSATPTKNAPGVVLLCQTSASLYLPCNATTPLATTGGGGGGGGAVTVADGADVTQGALADAACGTDNGTCTEQALIKRNNQRLTTINTTLGAPAQVATYGAAFPATGVPIGISDGTNMVQLLTPSQLGDAITGASMMSAGGYLWNSAGPNWVRAPGNVNGFVIQGAAATANSKLGRPVQTGAVFNTTQPTVTTGQVVESQATARGAHIVATGVDAFNITDVTTAASVSSTLIPNNTTAIVVKGGAGTLYGITAFNNSATIAYIKVYNATSATAGSGTPVARFMIPANTAGTGLSFSLAIGNAYSTGITYIVTTGIADNDTSAPAANAYIVNVHYK